MNFLICLLFTSKNTEAKQSCQQGRQKHVHSLTECRVLTDYYPNFQQNSRYTLKTQKQTRPQTLKRTFKKVNSGFYLDQLEAKKAKQNFQGGEKIMKVLMQEGHSKTPSFQRTSEGLHARNRQTENKANSHKDYKNPALN